MTQPTREHSDKRSYLTEQPLLLLKSETHCLAWLLFWVVTQKNQSRWIIFWTTSLKQTVRTNRFVLLKSRSGLQREHYMSWRWRCIGGILHTRCCILGRMPTAQTILNRPTLLLCHLLHMCTVDASIKEFILYMVISHGCRVLKQAMHIILWEKKC